MVSVIIPLYNKAHTIVNTLTTVVHQTYKDFEVIIVNDGSTDNGVEVINTNFNDPRIRIINQENAGVSAARNRGANEAKGEWVVFLDADDEWMPFFLETVTHNAAIYPDCDIIGTAGFYKNFVTGKTTPRVVNRYINKTKRVNYYMNPDVFSHLGATLIRKKTFMEAGGFPVGIKVSEDVCLLLKIALKGHYLYCGNHLLHTYVGNVKGQTTSARHQFTEENRKDEAFVYNTVFQLWANESPKNSLVPIYIKYKLRHALLCFLRNDDYMGIKVLTEHLSKPLQELLGKRFIRLINNKSYKKIIILYLLFTKIIWRLHRFPRVGEKPKWKS